MYCRLKFNDVSNLHFPNSYSNGTTTNTINAWIAQVLNGTVLPQNLPTTPFDVSNCVVVGSLPDQVDVTNLTVSVANNTVQFTKRHSQNTNFTSNFRIYSDGSTVARRFGIPRFLSSNNTNEQPAAFNSGVSGWFQNTDTTIGTAGLGGAEYQFFISAHWIIWSVIDINGVGGTAGIFDVESTGSDVWARSINSLYSPQIFITSTGAFWPSTTLEQFTENANGITTGIYSNLMYNGEGDFINRGTLRTTGVHEETSGDILPELYPDINSAIFSTRDDIGDTQNYMIPVYMHGGYPLSTINPGGRAILNGRIPFLWRTSDNAGQTGQTATVGGVEYRFVRMHSCGGTTNTGRNAAVYMVPTTIGGV